MELIDVKTNRIYGLEELKDRIIKKAKRDGGHNPSVSLGKVDDDLAGKYGLAVIYREQIEDREDMKTVYSVPEKSRDGTYIRKATQKPLSKEEKEVKDGNKPADLSAVKDPVVRALARKMELTQREVNREAS